VDLGQRFGRGFGVDNLQRFRAFYLEYPSDPIYATPSLISQNQSIAKPQGSILPAASAESVLPGTLELP
jgi:hypothetical protein